MLKLAIIQTQDNVIRVREKPNLTSQVVFTVSNGDEVITEFENNQWSKIYYKDGRLGYILNRFLKEENSEYITMTQEQLKELCEQLENLLNILKRLQ